MRRNLQICTTLDSAGRRKRAQIAADAGCRRAESNSVAATRPWSRTIA